MENYIKQTWNNFNKSLTLEENIKRNAVVTGTNMNHIENGIYNISSSVTQLEIANKELSDTIDTVKETLKNIPGDLQLYLESIQAQNATIMEEIAKLKTQMENIKSNSVDDLALSGSKLQVTANGVPLGDGVNVVIPSNDEELDGIADGIINVDDITYEE